MTDIDRDQDLGWMRRALDLARLAAAEDEVPVGAVLVRDGQLLATGHNQPITANDPSAHAEMACLREAAQRAGNYRLTGTTLYVTLEPCVMCVGALVHARVRRLVYAANEPRTGAVESRFQLLADGLHNHRVIVEGGLLADESARILQDFFRARRGTRPPFPHA